jgi:RimJ/RimL family protein N-acetyltransferase
LRVGEPRATGLEGVVRLRPTTERDLDFVLRAEWNEEDRPYIGRWPRERHLAALAEDDAAHLMVERSGDGTPVGYAILIGLEGDGGMFCLKRLMVAEKGRGHGRAALKLVKDHAFGDLGAHRLWLDTFEYNARARRLYESEGFVTEGVLRESFWTEDGYRSLVVMSLLESEYRA